ncbi:MAG: hypothetical protein KC800_33075, partial [Candidatus Eremiobacteraeota bacterium]|nr:hypothetical protein [Candidatus Eremiobacteraeota bacterium]
MAVSGLSRARSWLRRNTASERDFNTAPEQGEKCTVPQNRNVHTLVAGAAVGAAVGAVAGGAVGLANVERTEEFTSVDIVDPEFTGYTYRRTEDTSEHCWNSERSSCYTTTDGYRHHYRAIYNEQVVGQYEKTRFFNSDPFGALKGATLGVVGGGLLGLTVGVAINILRETTGKGSQAPAEIEREHDRSLRVRKPEHLVAGTVLGAAVGAGAGAILGTLESKNNGEVSRTFIGPVREKTLLGYIPPDRYTRSRLDLRNAEATMPVYRNLPVYDENGE